MPETGDRTLLWGTVTGLSAAGLAGLWLSGRRKDRKAR
ncbi:MAG: LPXTG cell wall anchor domain-containing protein [Candidatus Enterenecus sp.]